jgi:uncharacterized protein YbjT (DUF2867 family)
VDTVLIISPLTRNRVELALNAFEACKLSPTLRHIVIVSVILTGQVLSEFPRRFADQGELIEEALKQVGVAYTILRLPTFFMDDYLDQVPAIVNERRYFGPLPPHTVFACTFVRDIGEALACVLAKPDDHIDRTYTVLGAPISEKIVSGAFSAAWHRSVRYEQVSLTINYSSQSIRVYFHTHHLSHRLVQRSGGSIC